MTIKRISKKEIRKSMAPGAKITGPVPAGLPPVLRASWRFAQNMSQRFSRELIKDRAEELLKKLRKRFV